MLCYDKPSPKTRMLRLELRHACAAIERARLIAKGMVVEADVARLLEMAEATVDLVEEGKS